MTDSCRLALPSEADQIAALQRRSWSETLPAPLADEMLRSVDLETMTRAWSDAINKPPLATLRVLVAVSAGRVVGFAAIGPSDDVDASPADDGLVGEFVIDPGAQRQGHGSRLMNAVADTLRADGFKRATWWIRSTDDAMRSFITSAGWDADGAHREIAMGEDRTRIKMIRLHTAL